MIYTVTFNPALDYIIRLDKLLIGETNRVSYEQALGGGKGINVSIVLKNMGIDNTALGFCAGFTGGEIIRQLNEHNCRHDFIQLDEGFSRINVKLRDAQCETEINGQGPSIPEAKVQELWDKLNTLQPGDGLVLAGSIPHSLPDDIYQQILKQLTPKGVKVIVDATKDLLVNVLPYKPFLVKPNHHELAEIFNPELKSREDIITYGKKLQAMGAENVIVSMGGDGAVLIASDGETYYSPVPKGKLVNSTGAGDSLVAGFITGYVETKDLHKAFLRGVATGSASAFSTQLATRQEVEALLATLQ